jgi:hypothetical protein
MTMGRRNKKKYEEDQYIKILKLFFLSCLFNDAVSIETVRV